ncbi:glutaminyl-peptide cyclotransferase [Chloroflexota bacterium]
MNPKLNIFLIILFTLLVASVVCACSDLTESPTSTASDLTPVYTYNVVNSYPHDMDAFTQGLSFEEGVLYEGTGRYPSTLRRVELETGIVLQMLELPDQLFGEGVTIYGDKIIQLTWLSNVGFVYDQYSFEVLQQFNYQTEGWGIASDGKRLIMSDGTSTLHFLDPETFEKISQIEVQNNNISVTMLNELEYVRGEIYANIWGTDRIARIAPNTGQVIGWIELTGLLSLEGDIGQVGPLNGIAYDTKDDRLFVTGKLWPKLFEIELVLLE